MTIGIIGTGSYLPEHVVTNEFLVERMGVDEEWILKKTGISERRLIAPDEATSDLAARASTNALDAADVDASDVDFIVLATGTGDQPAPATACFVQAKIRATNAICFDVTAVCSGFLYALRVAHDMLAASPDSRYALVIGADAYSRFSAYEEAKGRVLVGDGAGCAVLGKVDSGGIIASKLGTDGTLAEIAQIPGGGSRRPASAETLSSGLHNIKMDGRKIREIAGDLLLGLVTDLTASVGLTIADLDVVIPHQANRVMLTEWCEILGIEPDRMPTTVERYGNTGAATVPVTLDECVRSGRLTSGDLILLVAIGGGVTWGASIIQWL